MKRNKKILIIDPNTGGGIRQASVYTFKYLRKFYSDVRFYSWGKESNETYVFKDLLNICSEWMPDLIIIHDTSFIKSVAFLKMVYPHIRLAYFSLCLNRFREPNYISVFDYYLSPYVSVHDNIGGFSHEPKIELISWMFNLPDEFSMNVKEAVTDRSDDLLYVGRIEPFKVMESFIQSIARYPEGEMAVDIYGNTDSLWEHKEYYNFLFKVGSIRVHNPIPNGVIHKKYDEYKLMVLPSKTDCFSLISIEASYRNTLPIVIKDVHGGFVWANDMSPQYYNIDDFMRGVRMFRGMPDNQLKEFTEEHSRRVREKIKEFSNPEIMDEILNNPAPNRGYFDEDMMKKAGREYFSFL